MHIRSRSLERARSRHKYTAVLLAVAATLCASTAMACTSAYPGGDANLVIDTWDDTVADALISNWNSAGNANFLSGCSFSAPTPVDVTPAMPSLQYVRNVVVDGESFPAFEVAGRPRSPLLIFRYIVGNGSAGMDIFPFDVRTILNSSGAGVTGLHRWSVVAVAAVSRGGQMEGLPTTAMGSVTHVYPVNPSLRKVESFSVTANLRTKTCTLADTAFSLKDINAVDLPRAGSDAGAQEFQVAMNCNGAFPLTLALTDANAPGNTSSRLTPTTSADAQGVRVQLLREGTPVVLGQSWSLAQSQNGPQNIAITARYYREAGDFMPGVVQGQATLTVSYR